MLGMSGVSHPRTLDHLLPSMDGRRRSGTTRRHERHIHQGYGADFFSSDLEMPTRLNGCLVLVCRATVHSPRDWYRKEWPKERFGSAPKPTKLADPECISAPGECCLCQWTWGFSSTCPLLLNNRKNREAGPMYTRVSVEIFFFLFRLSHRAA